MEDARGRSFNESAIMQDAERITKLQKERDALVQELTAEVQALKKPVRRS
jgi:hypothetical protein